MASRGPTVSVTDEELVIRIPWNAMAVGRIGAQRRKRSLTAQDVLGLVDAGRLAHRLGKTRSVRSLKDLLS